MEGTLARLELEPEPSEADEGNDESPTEEKAVDIFFVGGTLLETGANVCKQEAGAGSGSGIGSAPGSFGTGTGAGGTSGIGSWAGLNPTVSATSSEPNTPRGSTFSSRSDMVNHLKQQGCERFEPKENAPIAGTCAGQRIPTASIPRKGDTVR